MKKLSKKNHSLEAYQVKAYRSLLSDLNESLTKILESPEIDRKALEEMKKKIENCLPSHR